MTGNTPAQTPATAIRRSHQSLEAGRAPSSLRVYSALTASRSMEEWVVTINLGRGAQIKMHPTSLAQEDGSGKSFNVEGFLVSSVNATYRLPSAVRLYINDQDHSGHVTIES